MGVKNYSSNNVDSYYKISYGKITRPAKQGDPEAVEETNSEGKSFWMIKDDAYEGRIIDIKIRDGKFGWELLIFINDGQEKACIQMSLYSSFAEEFMKRLPNIDFDFDVEIRPYDFTTDDGKRRKGVSLYQGNKIENFYNKEYMDSLPISSPDILPSWEKEEKKGKVYWNNDAAINFLWNMIEQTILPGLNGFDVATTNDDFQDQTEVLEHHKEVVSETIIPDKEFELPAKKKVAKKKPKKIQVEEEGDDLPF